MLIFKVYNGGLTQVTCAAAAPTFIIDDLYGPLQYSQLPSLFNIKAKVAQDRSNITLCINGTRQSNNLAIECKNVIDTVRGQAETLFQITLEFISKFAAITHLF